MLRFLSAIAAFGFSMASASAQSAPMLTIASKFEGGSIKVIDVDQLQRAIAFQPPEQPNGGWRTWWFFHVEGIKAGETLRLAVKGGQAASERPVVSLDGKSWKFMDAKDRHKVTGENAYFAWYVPYLSSDAAFVADWAERQSPSARKFELCRSEEGRPVWGVQVTEPGDSSKRPVIWIHARQHAWEVGSSWTAHGLIQWLVSNDPAAKSLRENAVVIVVPIMDVDNVAKGLGGKDQMPHDHNRDWLDQPHWNAVRAAQRTLQPYLDDRRLAVFLDLHNPGWGAGRNLEFWCTGYKSFVPTRKTATDRFLGIVRGELVGPIVFRGLISESTPAKAPTSVRWVREKSHDGVVAGTFEIPIDPGRSLVPPPGHHLELGRELGRSLSSYVAQMATK